MARTFRKYKVRVTKVEEVDIIEREYKTISDTGGKDGKTEYGYVPKQTTQLQETEVLMMEIDKEDKFDLTKTVKAILGL